MRRLPPVELGQQHDGKNRPTEIALHQFPVRRLGSFGVADFLGMKWAEDGEIVADYLIGSSPCQDLPHKARWGDKK